MKRAVVDQPGLRIIVLGLVVSIIFGLSIKNQISSKKIKLKIDQSLVKLQTDVNVDFKTVEIKLSDWGWPQPYLEIHDIRLSPLKKVCDESQVFIDTLSFPLTWNLFFENKKIVNSLRINQMELRISEFAKCFAKSPQNNYESENATAFDIQSSSLYQSLLQVFTANNSGELRNLKIDRIKVLSKSNYGLPIYLQSAFFEFSYDSQMLSKVNLSAQLLSYKDNVKKIYNLRSDLNLIFEKTTANSIAIVGDLNGKIIDRSYQIKFDYDLIKNGISFNFGVEKAALKTILQYIDLDKKDFFKIYKDDISAFYLTSHGNGFFNLDNNQIEQIYIKDLFIDSGATSIVGDDLHIKNIKNIEQQALVFKVNNFNLNMMTKNKKWTSPFLNEQVIESGLFSGDVSWLFGQELRAQGSVRSIVFSLVSKKELQENWQQKINSAKLDFLSTSSRAQLTLSDLIMNDQTINGFVNYSVVHTTDNLTHETENVEFAGNWLSQNTVQNILGAEKVFETTLKIKRDKNQDNVEFKAPDFNYYDLKVKNMDVKIQRQLSMAAAKSSIRFKADDVFLDKNLNVSENKNKFIKWFSEIENKINFKKIDIDGELDSDEIKIPLQIRSEVKGKSKKSFYSLDFKNNNFLEINN